MFQEYKRLSDSHQILLVKMYPSRYMLNLLHTKILFSRFPAEDIYLQLIPVKSAFSDLSNSP